MRSISDALKARFESRQQTSANNADPRLWALLSREHVPLTDPALLEKSLILTTDGLTACSVALRRPRANEEPDAVYAAYIDENGARVKKAALSAKLSALVWEDAGFSADADDIAVAFNGTMPKAPDGTAQFVTERAPWVFWIKDGVLKGKILGLLGDVTLASANAGKVSAIRATWTPDDAADYGLVVFFTLNGALYYRQLIGSEWMDAEPISFGPTGVTWTDIAAFRTWDYRIGVQAVGSDGKVYELFTQFQGIAKHGAEHLSLDVRAASKLLQIGQIETQEQEHLSLGVTAGASILYRTGAPQLVAAANIDDGTGDWGKKAVFEFDRHIVAAEVAAQPSTFRIVDANGSVFFADSATLSADMMTVTLTFPEFNNAVGACKAKYVPGTVHSMAGDLLVEVEKSFTPQNLVAPGTAVPAPSAISNTADTVVTIVFSAALTGGFTGLADHFTAALQVPEWSPGGQLLPETRTPASVALSGTDTLILTFPAGSRTDLCNAVGSVTVSYDGMAGLMGAGGTVQPFDMTFTPVGLTPKNDSMETEHIELAVAAAGLLTQVTWRHTQDPEHIELTVTAAGVLTHVNDL